MRGAVSLTLSALDARVLRATDARGMTARRRESASSRAARRTSRCRRCAGCALPVWWRTTASARNDGFAPIAAMWRWSTSHEPGLGRIGWPVSESPTG
jgi:hypothetical protein